MCQETSNLAINVRVQVYHFQEGTQSFLKARLLDPA